MSGKVRKPVTLVGFMGSGKTSVGRELARLLGLEQIDLDREIEAREGTTINEIFRTRGEPYFRQRESAALEDATARGNPAVICSGGGIVMDPRNAALIKERSVSVWLKAKPETVYARIREEGTRPVLNDGMSLEKITALMERRLPYYEAASRFAVDTDGKSVDQIAREIAEVLTGIA